MVTWAGHGHRSRVRRVARTSRAPYKVTLSAPSNFMFASFKAGATDRVYPTRAALLDAVARIVYDEVRWLLDQGVRYIQLDAPYYLLSGRAAARAHDRAGRRPRCGPRVGHCRRQRRAWRPPAGAARQCDGGAARLPRQQPQPVVHFEGAYDAIAERLFATLDVDRFLLEYNDERSGSFAPLRLLPAEDRRPGTRHDQAPGSSPATRCCGASTKRRGTFRWPGWRSARSAGSHRSRPETC